VLASGSSAPDPFPAPQPRGLSTRDPSTPVGCRPARPRSQWRGPRGNLTRFPLRLSPEEGRPEGRFKEREDAYRVVFWPLFGVEIAARSEAPNPETFCGSLFSRFAVSSRYDFRSRRSASSFAFVTERLIRFRA